MKSDLLRRFVTQETVIASLANAVVPSLFIAFLSSGYPVGVWGSEGLIASVAKPTIGVAIGMTLILTFVIRKRIGNGNIDAAVVSAARPRWLRLVPANLILRTAVLACLSFVIIMPLVILVAHGVGIEAYDKMAFVAFNFGHGLALGMLLAPLIALAAIRDADRKHDIEEQD